MFTAPAARAASLLGPSRFRLLGRDHDLPPAGGWDDTSLPKLWRYNLHYFDDLNADASVTREAWHRTLLHRWVAENPPGIGCGWEPYPTSLRIVNWVKWSVRCHALHPDVEHSLAIQARWLAKRLEHHLLGNHLLANAKALVHAGLYFEGAEAARWRARGLELLERELREQILPDGGHFELSPMYHATVLEDLLDLVNLMRAYGLQPSSDWLAGIARMQRWLRVMTHPDGNIAFFNDAAFGIAPPYAEISAYASRLGLPNQPPDCASLVSLEASGYVRARAGPAYLLCDCAPLGPDHLPAHAHADTLSFELSIGDQRVFVNSGTSQYGIDFERQRQRGTAAHNTVVLDGRDSSEVWAGFRVARRARVLWCSAQASASAAVIEGRHDGYRRLPGGNEHSRRWTLQEHSLCVEDRVSGAFHSAEARFHLHPRVMTRESVPGEIELAWSGGPVVRMSFEGAANIEITPGTWHPEFGAAVANRCVIARFAGASLTTRVRWAVAS